MVVGPILLLRDVMQGCIEAYKAWYWGNQKHPGNNQNPMKAIRNTQQAIRNPSKPLLREFV